MFALKLCDLVGAIYIELGRLASVLCKVLVTTAGLVVVGTGSALGETGWATGAGFVGEVSHVR